MHFAIKIWFVHLAFFCRYSFNLMALQFAVCQRHSILAGLCH